MPGPTVSLDYVSATLTKRMVELQHIKSHIADLSAAEIVAARIEIKWAEQHGLGHVIGRNADRTEEVLRAEFAKAIEGLNQASTAMSIMEELAISIHQKTDEIQSILKSRQANRAERTSSSAARRV